jgi:hypothetical protein
MITEEKKIRQKKISTIVNFSDSWPGSSTENTIHEKNHKAWSLENETLKDEIKKNYTKNPKNKSIKTMKVKIKIKNKLKNNNKFSIW